MSDDRKSEFPIWVIAFGLLLVGGIWFVAYGRNQSADEERQVRERTLKDQREWKMNQVHEEAERERAKTDKLFEKALVKDCWACKGRGLVKDEEGLRTCPTCEGRGKK